MIETMTAPTLVGLGGTLRERSFSRAALQETLRLAEAHGACTELLDLRALDLPMYIPDIAVEDYPPEHQAALRHFVETLRRADALIWASPAYHGTVSGVFKNALDFVELLSDDDPPYLTGRAVGLIAVNDSLPFEAMANAAYELRAWLAPTRLVLDSSHFTPDLTLKPGRPQKRAGRLVAELIDFAARLGENGRQRLSETY